MAEINKTTDYDKFNYLKCNRPISQKHVNRIKKSIEFNNLLEFSPIMVDENFSILDGQHRLLAAKEMQVPIYYTVSKSSDDKALILLNANSKPWGFEDYVHYYSSKGVRAYTLLRELATTHEITINSLMRIFNIKTNKEGSSNFKLGKLSVELLEQGIGLVETVKKITENIHAKLPASTRGFLKSAYFYRALAIMVQNTSFDMSILLGKLEYRVGVLRRCTNVSEYLKLLQGIYNYRNSDPITLLNDDGSTAY